MIISRLGPLDGQRGIPSSFAGQPVFECPLTHACWLSLRKEEGCGEARLVRAFASTSETSGFLTTPACPAGREKVPVCQRETVGLAKAGPRAFCTKLQNWCRQGFGSRTTSDFRAMTV